MFTTWSGCSSIEQQQPIGGTNKPPVAAASLHVATTPTPSYEASLTSPGGAGGAGARSQANANGLLLPHDAALSEIYTGTSATEYHQHTTSVAPSSLQNPNIITATRPSASAPHAGGSPQSSSPQNGGEPAGASAAAAAEAIFDGLFPDEPGFSSSSSSSSSMGAAQRLLWTHLERILELQTDLAGMHMQMERIGVVPDQPATSNARTHHHQRSDKSSKLRDDRSMSMSMDGGGAELDALAGDDDDDENNGGQKKDGANPAGKNSKKNIDGMGGDGNDNDNDGDENAGAASDPKQEFASLADSFTGRKKAIDSIMAKLDDLSQEVTRFHALVAPTIDLSSRANTKPNSMGSTAAAVVADGRPTLQDISAKRNPNHPVLSSLVNPGDDHRKKHIVESPASLRIDGLP